jgi:hypothetical protein
MDRTDHQEEVETAWTEVADLWVEVIRAQEAGDGLALKEAVKEHMFALAKAVARRIRLPLVARSLGRSVARSLRWPGTSPRYLTGCRCPW